MLPILLSIPHGGTRRPEELDGRTCITDKALFDDFDPFTIEIYDLGNKVLDVIKTDIARAFVDLNRSVQEMPPQNPDGLIKSTTCHRKPIYINSMEPNAQLTNTLIKKYYMPYHHAIQNKICNADVKFCLDCHSMASKAPAISPDNNAKKRPAFCLSNWDGKSSSPESVKLLAECISESFSVDMAQISFNDPFHGGYITKTYGNNPVPWIQVEMSRDLYLSKQWFDSETLTVDKSRLYKLNQMFEAALSRFSRYW